MTDINGLLNARIADLERQLAAKDVRIKTLETSNPAWELLISTQNEVVKWKKEVIKWQDTDTENQRLIEAKDVEIADLKHDLDAVIDQQLEEVPITLQERNAEIADLKRGFIDVEEACGFKVIPEDVKDKETASRETIERIKADLYVESDDNSIPRTGSKT